MRKALCFLLIYLALGANLGADTKHKRAQNIIAVGAVPVISSFIFALQRGDMLRNALPEHFKTRPMTPKLYNTLTPHQAKEPHFSIANSTNTLNLEQIWTQDIDLVITMDRVFAKSLQEKGIDSLALEWRNGEDATAVMRRLATILDAKDEADRYIEYFWQKLNFIKTKLKEDHHKPKVLFMDFSTLSNPHIIADWWIDQAGGISATDPSRVVEKHSLSLEQIIKLEPEIIILSNPNDVEKIYQNKILSTTPAIKNKKVFASPSGVHLWAHRSSEQPLMLLWAAKTFHPNLFREIDLAKELRYFYATFLNYALDDEEIEQILYPI